MIEIYLFFGSVLLLAVIFMWQSKKVKTLEAIKNKLAEAIRLQRRQEKVQESQKTKQEIIEKKKVDFKKNVHYPEIKALLKQVEMDLAREKIDHAEKMLVQILALDPENKEGNEHLAFIYLQTGRYQKAAVMYTELAENYPKNAVNFANLGLAQYNLGEYEKAIEAYEASCEIDGKIAKRFASLGQIYLLVKKPKKALENFDKALRRDRRNTDYMFLLAESYKLLGDIEKFKEIIHKILVLQPYNQNAKEELRKLAEQQMIGEAEMH